MPVVDEHRQTPIWDEASLANPHRIADKAKRVRRMFDTIAGSYERINTVSSAGRDRHWRRSAVRLSELTPGERVLDIACGTGDFARAFASAGAADVVGVDFADDMLALAAARPLPCMSWCLADAQRLPFTKGAFDLTACAFGVRNFDELSIGLSEMRRVLRPGGRAVILEFSFPRRPMFRWVYRIYLQQVLPRVASWMSGDRNGAYDYLARSVMSFVDENQMHEAILGAGFDCVRRHPLSWGIVQVYVARVAESSSEVRP